MSLSRARKTRRSVSLRIASVACATGVGLVVTGPTATAQEKFLKIAFPQSAVQKEILQPKTDAALQRDIQIRERAASTSAVEAESTTDANASNNEAAAGESTPTVNQADETNRQPIRVPTLVVPNTAPNRSGSGTMPDDMVAGRLPAPIQLPFGPDRTGMWTMESKTWMAPVYCHQPTYFHDSMLEEHGHERCPSLQPLISGARFYSQLAFLPYLSYLNPPLSESPSAGHFRPGTAAPCVRQRAPYDPGATGFQLMATGTAVLAVQP